MYHEYRDEISKLKTTNKHFERIFNKHNELDQKIQDASEGRVIMTDIEITMLKKEKLALKEELLKLIKEHKNA